MIDVERSIVKVSMQYVIKVKPLVTKIVHISAEINMFLGNSELKTEKKKKKHNFMNAIIKRDKKIKQSRMNMSM